MDIYHERISPGQHVETLELNGITQGEGRVSAGSSNGPTITLDYDLDCSKLQGGIVDLAQHT